MKKLFGVIALAIIVATIFAVMPSCCAFAQTVTDNSIHFIAPKSLAMGNNKLYVSDVVETGKSVIVCFDVATDTPTYLYTTADINGEIQKLSYFNDGQSEKLYAVTEGKVICFEIGANKLTQKQSFSLNNVVDVAVGQFVTGNTLYALSDKVRRSSGSENTFDLELYSTFTNGKQLLSIGEYLYCLANGSCFRLWATQGGLKINNDTFDQLNTNGHTMLGLLQFGDNLAFWDKNTIFEITPDGQSFKSSEVWHVDSNIVFAVANNDTLYLLNDKSKIEVYTNAGTSYTLQCTIGTDTVDLTCPSVDQLTSFTLVTSQGYPTNVIYKTTQQDSITEVQTEYQSSYIVLGYENSENDAYYYVLVDGKFGWVKKCDGTTTPNDANSKLNVVDTTISNSIDYYFVSGNAVYVYKLPLMDSKYQVQLSQTFTDKKPAKILQRFVCDDIVWYYVGYADNQFGFVQQGQVGVITAKQNTTTTVEGYYKINSPLKAVTLHLTQELDDNEIVCDENGQQFKLFSGDKVVVIKHEQTNNGCRALVMYRSDEGTITYGWLDSSKIIDMHALTTNAIVGLAILLVVAITVTTLTIVLCKKKKKATQQLTVTE